MERVYFHNRSRSCAQNNGRDSLNQIFPQRKLSVNVLAQHRGVALLNFVTKVRGKCFLMDFFFENRNFWTQLVLHIQNQQILHTILLSRLPQNTITIQIKRKMQKFGKVESLRQILYTFIKSISLCDVSYKSNWAEKNSRYRTTGSSVRGRICFQHS